MWSVLAKKASWREMRGKITFSGSDPSDLTEPSRVDGHQGGSENQRHWPPTSESRGQEARQDHRILLLPLLESRVS